VIKVDPQKKTFHLQGAQASYLIALAPDGDPQLLHWGARLSDADVASLHGAWQVRAHEPFRDLFSREAASFGSNDLRSPAWHLEHGDGSRLNFFSYESHRVSEGKIPLKGLPSSVAEGAMTLTLCLEDAISGQSLELDTTIYPSLDVVVRRARLSHAKQGQAAFIRRAMSASLDLGAADHWLLSLPGDWARERMAQETRLPFGTLRLESRRGQSSHQMSPFCAVTEGPPSETNGAAWGVSLLYSGNWLIELEKHHSGRLRVNAGINDHDFRWKLEPGEVFETPECVLAYSFEGLGGLSRRLHRFVNQRIVRGPWRDKVRPALINSWEGIYFGVDHSKMIKLAKEAKDLGLDLVVLDDGWFGKRLDDTTSLGDWDENLEKFPKGISGLAQEIHALGMKFGLWFEPEAISPKSKLYEAHPDWALKVAGRPASTSRNQYMLDMSRAEVVDHIFERMSHYIGQAKLDYVKWDFNRPLWEVGGAGQPGDRQAEISHRCMLGSYALMRRLQERFPDLLVEGCAGGGGRYDYGQLCFHPQFWASDNTDGHDRIFIQYGSSYFLPPSTMGSHLSTVPNHTTGRNTPFMFRSHVALSGNFGVELDTATLSAEEKEQFKEVLRLQKRVAPMLLEADFFRLENPFVDCARAAWSFVSQNRRDVAVFAMQIRGQRRGLDGLNLQLQGLDPSLDYVLEGTNHRYSGKLLMTRGFKPDLEAGDYKSVCLFFKAST
jgi:alpha-galactosidase